MACLAFVQSTVISIRSLAVLEQVSHMTRLSLDRIFITSLVRSHSDEHLSDLKL